MAPHGRADETVRISGAAHSGAAYFSHPMHAPAVLNGITRGTADADARRG